MKHQSLTFIGAVLLLANLTACSLFDKPEDLPVYLDLQQSSILLDSSQNFTSPAGLKDLWIDHNGLGMGVHRIPRVIPLLMEGDNRLTFSGGIFENGLSSIRSRYPFWIPQTIELDANPLDTIPFQFTFSYYPDTILAYPFKETFEEASSRFASTLSGSNQTSLSTTTLEAFEGNFGGRVNFNQSAYNFEAIANEFIALPQRGTNDVYMEISYKNTIPFSAGLLYVTANGADLGDLNHGLVYQSDTWNTVYIHINDQIRSIGSTALFKPYIRASSLNNSTGEIREGQIFLDNIRIIHFK